MNQAQSQAPVIIVNPAAGHGRCRKRLPKFRNAAERRLPSIGEADWLFTERAGHARELARDYYQRGRRTFWAVGGDGTGFEVVNGLLDVDDHPEATLGIVPLGTGNSFLRQFGITDADSALNALESGETTAVDVVRLEHAEGVIYSINLICLGFAAQVGSLTNQRYKPLGAMGYVAAVLVSLIRPVQPKIPYRLDGGSWQRDRCTMLAFCNSTYTGGSMKMAPDARVDDGLLDVVHLDDIPRRKLLTAFPRLFKGTHVDLPSVRPSQAVEVDFNLGEPIHVLVDGEIIEMIPQHLKVLPGRLQIISGR